MDRVLTGGGSFFRRRHLIELHEQPWFPEVWRDLFRTGLGKAFVLTGLSRQTSCILAPFLSAHRPVEVLDLCSGSGELSIDSWRRALSAQEGEGAPPSCQLILSDLYPTPERWTALDPSCRHIGSPLDVRQLGDGVPRTWMMLNTLHHFRPEQLRDFLKRVATSADGVVLVDRDARNWREMLFTVFVVPIAAALVTAFLIRPFRIQNVLWGLLFPVIPLVAMLDGIVSNLRSYTVEELRGLVADGPVDFTWRVDAIPGENGAPPMVYIIGVRRGDEREP